MRHDLLALTEDDLALISNRGTLKRALKELEGATVTVMITDDEGALTFAWSDEVRCILPPDATVAQMSCTCPATSVCRHRIRCVLAYKAWAMSHAPQAATAGLGAGPEDVLSEGAPAHADQAPPMSADWDPGAFGDDEIKACFSAARIRAAKKLYDSGLVVELVRSRKPMAHFHRLGHTLRFQVPGDLRYTQCDCAEEPPCLHVPCAIWAARELGKDSPGGFVTTAAYHPSEVDSASEILEQAEAACADLLQHGFTGTPASGFVRFEQLEAKLRALAHTWPASILAEIRHHYGYYQEHNTRFDAAHVAELIGEFLIRKDALNQPKTHIPRLFIQGSAQNTRATLGQTRFVGLGCVASARKRAVTLSAILQDTKTGTLVALGKEFVTPDEGDAPPFCVLAARHLFKDRNLASLGAGQLVVKRATLLADHHIELGRSPASIYPQSFQWEQLRPPILDQGFDETRARLQTLPPASLRPRRIGENFRVLPVAGARDVRFSVRDQAVMATLRDHQGQEATLVHPYTSRNRLGTERLLARLGREPECVRFVSGTLRVGVHGVSVSPVGVIFEDATTGQRQMLQPWIDDFEQRDRRDDTLGNARPKLDPMEQFGSELIHALGELYLVGLRHVDTSAHARWVRLQEFGMRLGMQAVMGSITEVCNVLDPELDIQPKSLEALQTQSVFETTVMAKMLQDLS